MARGRLLKTVVKEAKAIKKAELKAEAQFLKTEEGMEVALKKWFGTLKFEALDLLVFGASTWLIYQTIGTLTTVMERIITVVSKEPYILAAPLFGLLGIIPAYFHLTREVITMRPEAVEFKLEPPFLLRLALSMVIAYLIMKHGWELLNFGIEKLALLMLGT